MFESLPDDLGWLPDAPLDVDEWDDEREAAEFDEWAAEFDAARLQDLRAALDNAMDAGQPLLHLLYQFDPADLPAELRVGWAHAWQSCQAWADARLSDAMISAAGAKVMSELVDVVTGRDERGVATTTELVIVDANVAELGAALRLSPVTIQRQVDLARDLDGPWHLLGEALSQGRVTMSHVRAVREHMDRIPRSDETPEGDVAYAEICDRILDSAIRFAARHTPGQTGKYCRGLVEQVDPEGMAARRAHAKLKADVSVMDDVDDQSVFSVRTDTASAHAMFDAVNTLAGDPRFVAPGRERAGQRRAAAAATLILKNLSSSQGTLDFADPETEAIEAARVSAHVQVAVSLDTLLSVSNQPGTVAGVPVAAEAVLDLIDSCGPKSTLRRLVTDPESGALLDVGRRSYAVSDSLRRFIAIRDGSCRFPGCSRRAERCEVDHVVAFGAGGETTRLNCGLLCKKHHDLKTHHRWRIIEVRDDGACVWKSPLLKRYERAAARLLPPLLPGLPSPRTLATSDADDDLPF